jgi:hypothetical protein
MTFIARESDWPHPACLSKEDLMRDVTIGQGRTSGPGGQHRNKVQTQVILTHTPTGISAQAGERRSVRENSPVAITRLRLALATDHRIDVPIGEIGSRLWFSRVEAPRRGPSQSPTPRGRFDGRIVCNPKHWDYPSLLAEAMDVLCASAWDPRNASLRLEVSASQLIKLVQNHTQAWARLNDERESMGQSRLR